MTLLRAFIPMALLSIAACAERAPVSDAIRARAADGAVIDVAALTKFEWESLYVFSPYTPNGVVCEKIGSQLDHCTTKIPSPGIDEGNYLLAFTRKGRVVHYELYARGKADFCQVGCLLEIPRGTAVFKVGRVPTQSGWSQQFYLSASAA